MLSMLMMLMMQMVIIIINNIIITDDDVVDYDDIDSDDLLYSCATLLFSNIIAMQVWKYHHGIIDLSQHVIA